MLTRDYRLGERVVSVTVDGKHPAPRDLDICIRPVMSREERRGHALDSSEILATHLTDCLGFLGRSDRYRIVSVVVHDGTNGAHLK